MVLRKEAKHVPLPKEAKHLPLPKEAKLVPKEAKLMDLPRNLSLNCPLDVQGRVSFAGFLRRANVTMAAIADSHMGRINCRVQARKTITIPAEIGVMNKGLIMEVMMNLREILRWQVAVGQMIEEELLLFVV